MKNQNDIIVLAVAIVLTIGAVLAFAFTQRPAAVEPSVTPVPLTPVAVPEGTVVYSDSLPNAGEAGGSGQPGGFGGTGGGAGPSGLTLPGNRR